MSDRPLFIGEAPGPNTRPDCPLFPAPERSAGHNLFRLSPFETRGAWLAAIERINLLPRYYQSWPAGLARDQAQNLLGGGLLAGRTVVVMGSKAAVAFGFKTGFSADADAIMTFKPVIAPVGSWTCQMAYMPHPSGRCRWYNEEENVEKAKEFLRGIFSA